MDIDPNLVGLAHGMGLNLRDAQRNAQEWSNAYYRMEAQRNALAEELRKLKGEVADLTDRLAVKESMIEGLKAALNGFKEAHPDSPLMEKSGEFRHPNFKGQATRMKYHDLYDAAFDKKASECGISDPEARRPH